MTDIRNVSLSRGIRLAIPVVLWVSLCFGSAWATPTMTPTMEPTWLPTEEPTLTPTLEPTSTDTPTTTSTPTLEPTSTATPTPTSSPTATRTRTSTTTPTRTPTSTSTRTSTPTFTTIPTATATPLDDLYEPNDTCESLQSPPTPTPFPSATLLSSIRGSGLQCDDDWYPIAVPAGVHRIIVNCLFMHSEGNIDLELVDDSCTLLAPVLGLPYSEGTSDNEEIDCVMSVPANAIYFIGVYGENRGTSYNLSWTLTDDFTPLPTAGPTLPSTMTPTRTCTVTPTPLDDLYEPNDSCAVATAAPILPQATPISGIQWDQDWYHILLPAGLHRLTVDCQFPSPSGDIDIALMDQSCSLATTCSGSPQSNGSGSSETLLCDLLLESPVDYFIVVHHADDGTAYTLNWSITPGSCITPTATPTCTETSSPTPVVTATPTPVDDDYEPNDSCAELHQEPPPPVLVPGFEVNALQWDEDWYPISLTAGTHHVVVQCSFVHAQGDIDIALANSECLSPETCSGLPWSDGELDGESINVYLELLQAETFYIRVYQSDLGNPYTLWWTDAMEPCPLQTATPTATVTPFVPSPTPTPIPMDDPYEPNDSCASLQLTPTPTPYPPGELLSDRSGLGRQYDDDWYPIALTQGIHHVIVDCLFIHAEGDIDVALYGPDCSLVDACSGRALADGATDNERVDCYVHVPTSGTYFIRVYGDCHGNAYDLAWADFLTGACPTNTSTPTFTSTPTPSVTAPTSTPTATDTVTPTVTPTGTPTMSPTFTSTPVYSATPTATATTTPLEDSHEPDDRCPAAAGPSPTPSTTPLPSPSALPPGQVWTGYQWDDDWYPIHLSAGTHNILLECTFTHLDGDINVGLYNEACVPVFPCSGNGDSTGTTDNETIDCIVSVSADQTFFVRVYGENRGNEYHLYWFDLSADPCGTPTPLPTSSMTDDSYEPNDRCEDVRLSLTPVTATPTPATATPTPATPTGTATPTSPPRWLPSGTSLYSIRGNGRQLNMDWYPIQLSAGIHHLLINCLFYHAEGDIALSLYSSDCRLAETCLGRPWSDGDTDGEIIDVVVNSALPETFFIRVSGRNSGNEYDLYWTDEPLGSYSTATPTATPTRTGTPTRTPTIYTSTPSSTPTSTRTATATPAGTCSVEEPGEGSNDQCGNSAATPINVFRTPVVGYQCDEDWFLVNDVPAGYQNITVDCTFPEIEGDIDLELWDSSCALAVPFIGQSWSNNTTGGQESVDCVVDTPGDYYIRVYHADNGQRYELSCGVSVYCTRTPTMTPTITPTLTGTPSATMPPTATVIPTASLVPTATPTQAPTETATPIFSSTSSPTATETSSPTATSTLTPTFTRTPTLTPTPVDAYEPNEDCTQVATRTPIPSGQWLSAYQASDLDVDFYPISLPAGTHNIVVDCLFNHEDGTIDLELCDSSCQPLAPCAGSALSVSTPDGERIDCVVTSSSSQTFRIGVHGDNSFKPYSLYWNNFPSVICVPPTATPTATATPVDDKYEENDSCTTPKPLPYGTPIAGIQLDEDWYQLVSPTPGIQNVIIECDLTQPAGEIHMGLYDSQCELVDPCQGIPYASGTSGSVRIDCVLDIQAGQSYTVRVQGANAGAGYSLFWTVLPGAICATPTAVDDSYEPNDTCADLQASPTPSAIPESQVITGYQADEDWYRIEMPVAGIRRLMVTCDFVHAQGDIDMELRDDECQLATTCGGDPWAISKDDDEILVCSLDVQTAPKTYYIRLHFGNRGNVYHLSWEDSPGACSTATPTATETRTPTNSPTRTPTRTFTPTMTPTVSPTGTPTMTATMAPTVTSTPLSRNGWTEVHSDTGGSVTGLLLYGDKNEGTRDMAGLPGSILASKTHYLAHFASDRRWYTGVGVANPNPEAATLSFTAYGQTGTNLGTVSRNVQGNGKLAETVKSLFGGGVSGTGWLKVESDREVVVFDLYGDSVSGGIAALPSSQRGTSLILPHFVQSKRWWTGISIMNPGDQEAQVTLKSYKIDGSPLDTQDRLLGPSCKIVGYAKDILPLTDGQTGWISVQSDRPVTGLLVYGDKLAVPNRIAAVAAAPPSQVIYFSHFSSDQDWWTGIALVNPNKSLSGADLVAYDSSGALIGSKDMDIPALNKTMGFVHNIFSLGDHTEGWVSITSDQPLAGLQILNADDAGEQAFGLAGIEAQLSGESVAFSHHVMNERWWTLLALANPSPDLTVSAVLNAYESDGTVDATVSVPLPPKGHLAGYLQDLFGW